MWQGELTASCCAVPFKQITSSLYSPIQKQMLTKKKVIFENENEDWVIFFFRNLNKIKDKVKLVVNNLFFFKIELIVLKEIDYLLPVDRTNKTLMAKTASLHF